MDNEALRPHSELYFTEQRDFWWNTDFFDLMSKRWQLDQTYKILDVGCGVGHWSKMLSPYLSKDAEIHGVDLEPKWIHQCQKIQFPQKTFFQVASAYTLPYEDDSFDMVTCQTVLIHLKEPKSALKECLRVLKPGGLLAVAEPNNAASVMLRSNLDLDTSVKERLNGIKFQMICDLGKIRLGEGDNSLGDVLPGYFAECGLKDIQTYLSDKAMALIPDYTTAEQQALIEDFEYQVKNEIYIWDKVEAQKYYLAGGGNIEDFNKHLKDSKKQMHKILRSMKDKTYHCANGLIFYLISGRKP